MENTFFGNYWKLNYIAYYNSKILNLFDKEIKSDNVLQWFLLTIIIKKFWKKYATVKIYNFIMM